MLEKYRTICEKQYRRYLKYPKEINSESNPLFTIQKYVCWKAVTLEIIQSSWVLNSMSKISQHDAAANKANVTSIFVKRLFYGSLPLYRTFTENIIDNSVFRYACYKNEIMNEFSKQAQE